MANLVDTAVHQASGFKSALTQIRQRPLTSLLTTFSIALAMTLPGLLLSAMEQLESQGFHIENDRRLNIFLAIDTDPSRYDKIVQSLLADERSGSIEVIEPDEALQSVLSTTDLEQTIAAIESNPLPATLILHPAEGLDNASIQAFADEIRTHADVDLVRLDTEYLQRLSRLTRFLGTLVIIVSVLFLALVSLVLMNNARLTIQQQRDEIEVTKLVGGTDGYIIRPFVYQALLLCLAGSVIAVLLISLILAAISPTLEMLTQGYETSLSLTIGPLTRWYLPLLTTAVSVTATWITVKSVLKRVQIQ